MKKLIFLFLVLTLLLGAFSLCKAQGNIMNEEELFNAAKQISDYSTKLNDDIYRKVSLILYLEFINNFPNSQNITDVYNEIALLYFGLKDYQKAIDTYTELYEKYPNTENGKNALFMVAFTYDETLRDKEKALLAYHKFLEKYPDENEGGKLGDSAKVMIEKLMSDDVIIKLNEDN